MSRFFVLFVTQAIDIHALQKLVEHADINLDEQDADGYTSEGCSKW